MHSRGRRPRFAGPVSGRPGRAARKCQEGWSIGWPFHSVVLSEGGASLLLFSGHVRNVGARFPHSWACPCRRCHLVVPSQVDAAELFSFPVDGDGVFISEGLDQMFGIFLAHIFNSKVVHH